MSVGKASNDEFSSRRRLGIEFRVESAIIEDIRKEKNVGEEIKKFPYDRLVDMLQSNLQTRDKHGNFTRDNLESSKRFIQSFNLVMQGQYMNAFNNKILTPDDAGYITFYTFARALVGQNRCHMEIFDMIERESPFIDSIEQQIFYGIRGYACSADEWLQQQGFLDQSVIWTSGKVEIKLILLGASAAGKSSLFRRYLNSDFIDSVSTLGCDLRFKHLIMTDMNSLPCRVALWDTAGQEKFKSISKQYGRGADGAILVFDSSEKHLDMESYLTSIIQEYRECLDDSDVPIILFGSKSDLIDADVIDKWHMCNIGEDVIIGSSKTGVNVQETFQKIISLAALRHMSRYPEEENNSPSNHKKGSGNVSGTHKEGVVRLSAPSISRSASGSNAIPSPLAKCCK